MKARFVFLLVLAPFIFLKAQVFQVKAKLQPVPQSGFYKIPLTPTLTSFSRDDLADLRIVDNKNVQVAYLLRGSRTIWDKASFREFPIISLKNDSGKTELVIRAENAAGISELSL